MDDGKVVQFPGENPYSVPGMSPAFIQAWDEFSDNLGELVEAAKNAGLPPQLLLGELMTLQAFILDNMRAPVEVEG